MMQKLILFVVLLVPCVVGCMESELDSKPSNPASILFVGNSFTSANTGLEVLVDEIATSKDSTSQLFTAALTIDGATLKQLWNNSNSRKMISIGAYEVVVLQGDIPEGDVNAFQDYAQKFIDEAKKSGTRPVLLMGWAYNRLNWISQQEMAQAHYALATASDVDVAPVGLAWERVIKQRPDIDLYASDKEHPSLLGSYLAACVVYSTITGESPVGTTSLASTSGISKEKASFLQQLAWDTVQYYD